MIRFSLFSSPRAVAALGSVFPVPLKNLPAIGQIIAAVHFAFLVRICRTPTTFVSYGLAAL
jgi:hypothetical protein